MLRKTFLFIVLAGMTLLGCTDFDCCTNSVIHATKKPVVLTNVGDSQTFVVSSSMAWKMTGTVPAWLSLDWTGYNPANPTGTAGVTNITATIQEPNTTGTERSASFTFLAANGDKAKVTVTQNATTIFEPDPVTWYDSNPSATSFTISTAAQLAYLATLVNSATNNFNGKTITLTGNIDLSAYNNTYDGGAGWAPIGTNTNRFRGTFDGNHHTISNLFINRGTNDFIGLFGWIEGASVQNLGIINVDITGNGYVGGVAGCASNGSISNCYATCAVSGSYNLVGGVAGAVFGGSVTNCYATGAVSGYSYVGGVVGYVDNSSITNCYAAGVVSGSDEVGGVTGYVYSSSVANCVALNPSITRTAGSAGTYFGRVVGNSSGTLTNNYANSGMAALGGAPIASGTGSNINGADCDAVPAATWWDAAGRWDTTGTNAAWDFTTIWQVAAGSYPTLR